jgi:lipopolysaccharide export system permease protein
MLFGLSLLANHSELIIMRASGVSPGEIMRKALEAGLVLIIIMTIVGEVVAPFCKHLAEKRKIVATSSGQALQTSQGLWLRQGENFFYIETVYSAHRIAAISRYSFNNQRQLLSASYAARGHYQDGAWHMENVQQSNISPDHVTTTFTPDINWYLALDPRLLRISLSSPEEMTLFQLSDYIKYQEQNHLIAANYQIAFWQRLLQPLASLVMMFLAIPFIFGPLRSVTTSLRLMLGVIVGFLFYILNQVFPPLSQVLNMPPFLAVILPILLFATAGYLLLLRVG